MENNDFVGKKVVVTGGAGFIGSNLVSKLVSIGAVVHVIDNLVAGRKEVLPSEAVLHQLDICDLEKILPVFKGAEFVFHLAALPRVQFSIKNPLETSRVNIDGTISVLEASRLSGVKRLVYSATSSAYGDQDQMPLKETMTPNPLSPYGLQKLFGEGCCQVWSRVYGLPTVSLRYFNVYGPGQSDEGDYALVIAKFLKQKKAGLPLTVTGDGSQTRDFTSVHDVVRANLLAATVSDIGSGEVFNIGAGNNRTILEVAELIGGEIQYLPPRIEPKHTLADIGRAEKILGWKPETTLEEGIDELKTLMNID